MVWDITTPDGSEAANAGDDRMREFKADVQTALRGDDTEGVEAMFPGSDNANPVFRYRGLKGATGARPATGQYGLFFDSTRNALQRDNGAGWDDIATVIPSGTVMVFYQAAAPVGWTKVTSIDDRALRVVSGATGGSTGGTHGLSTAITLAHSHTVAAHTHDMTHRHTTNMSGESSTTMFCGDPVAWGQGTETLSVSGESWAAGTFGTQSHSYAKTRPNDTPNTGVASSSSMDSQLSDITLAYADVILASKD